MGHEKGLHGSYYATKIISNDFKDDYEVKYEKLLKNDHSQKKLWIFFFSSLTRLMFPKLATTRVGWYVQK